MADWDVFVSYTHADQVAAGRIQAFVEDYPLPGGRKALRVFRDKTDLRAGELGRSIPEEIGKARVLMLCCSPAAARSGWVSREVEAFHSAHGADAPLVPLLLEGDPALVVPETLRGRDALILDLRGGWRLGRPRGNTRVELLRAVAAAANIPLRELIPWDLTRRRRRWAVLGASAAIAVAAVATTSTSAWMTRREADAAALRRDAETATLRIEAGDVAAGVAALGHTLARDRRGLLSDGVEIFRHWLGALPMAADSARTEPGLFRIAGRIYARGESNKLVPLDVAEPFVAVSPWPGRIVAAGPGGITVLDAATGARAVAVQLPPGTKVVALHQAPTGDALVVLARMALVENDEDKPDVGVPCTALLLRSAAGKQVMKAMRLLPRGDLFWHDCVAEQAEPQVDDAMWQAWPDAKPLPLLTLPALRPERTLWRPAGEAQYVPKRLGLARSMDDVAIAALGLDEVEGGASVSGEVVDLAGFADEGRRTFWGINVCGNSFVCVVRCTAPAAGKVSACTSGISLSALQAWQVFSPDARRFAHVSGHMSEPPLTVVDIATWARRAPDRPPSAPVAAAAFTADNARLAVLTVADELVVYVIAADGTPRYERAIGLGRGSAERRCPGRETVGALRGSQVAVLSGDCTLQLLEVATGTLVWRSPFTVDGAAAHDAQLAIVAKAGSLLVSAGGRVRLVHAGTGAMLSAPFDPAGLPAGLPASLPASLSGGQPSDAGPAQLVESSDGAPALEIGGHRFVRSPPVSAEAALRVLPVLDRYTLISTVDGRTPLDKLPGQ